MFTRLIHLRREPANTINCSVFRVTQIIYFCNLGLIYYVLTIDQSVLQCRYVV